MTPHLVVRSVAEEDIAAAALWYEARAAGLGADFLRAIDVTLAEIKRMPERFPVVHLECHRALLRRFRTASSSCPPQSASTSWPACTPAAIRAAGRSVSASDR